MSKIFVTSYPYVYERYFKVWDYFPEKEKLTFVLPKSWEAKGGKIKVKAPQRANLKIYPVKAWFTHSHYPVVRGLLKGWMPQAKNIIKQQAKLGDILYTAIEPNLLTTYGNARLAKKLGLKHVFFTWQNISYKHRLRGLKLKIMEGIIRRTIANSAGAICGNTQAAEILRTYAGQDFKILVAPISGVDVEKFQPNMPSDFRQKYGLAGKTVLTFAGVFDERKGISTLLDAFRGAYKENTNLYLVLIGVGSLRSFIDQFTQEHKLTSAVTVIDWLSSEDLAGALSNSDIFIHPSEPYGGWEEQFGYSMAEASASGLPVLSTRSGSIEQIVLDGKTGLLVEPGQSDQLTAAILYLSKKADLRKSLGKEGREYIKENFSQSIIAEKFYHFFKEL